MDTPEKLQKVEQVLPYRLILIMTCPGSCGIDQLGKLLNEWNIPGTIRIARLRLQAAHNSPDQFISDLQTAFLTPGGLPAVSPPTNLEDSLIVLLNSVIDYTQDYILVLENYHVIHATEIHSAVSLLLDYMPPCMHLVITSREPPPLPIPRLRVRLQMVELRV